MKLEKSYGIPVAPVCTIQFKNVAENRQKSSDMLLPFTYTPHPVIGLSPEALDAYLTGNDPDTGRPVIDEIVETLTKPVQARPLPVSSETDRAGTQGVLLGPDTEDNLQRLFYERGWTDGLPVILPTEERVQNMLAGTNASPDEVVGEIFQHDTGDLVRATVSHIAVIAVMAGARPEHFPVILATAATRQSSFMPSTTPFSGMLLVNGPIRNEIGMNSGIGAFSAVSLANSVIGRAWTLMSICWGYARPRATLWSAQGNNHTYNNMCAAENEERSVWTPFHVQKGFKPEESVVSVFRGWNLMNSLHAAAHRSVGEEISLQLSVIPALFSNAVIIMDPLVARNLKENEGFDTKQDFSRWISQNAMIPAGRYWGTDYIDMLVASQAYKGVEPYATWKKLPDDELIAHYHIPENINIVVVGGETSPLWKTADYSYGASASVDRWRAKKSGSECEDGSCGLPDAQVDYD
ncbi:MAG: hypothetical protein JXA46_11180 [Dehalococcoidales bacterium]|nr:hypothetical protein [Dehalococcoidales bacterium]